MDNKTPRRARRRTRQNPAVNTFYIGLMMSAALVNKVDAIAADENVTRSEIVRRAIEKFSPNEERRNA